MLTTKLSGLIVYWSSINRALESWFQSSNWLEVSYFTENGELNIAVTVPQTDFNLWTVIKNFWDIYDCHYELMNIFEQHNQYRK